MTTSKIFILSATEVKPTLLSFMDPSSIPKQYGGDLEWQWGDMPNLDDPAREAIGGVEKPEDGSGYLKGPMIFHGEKGEIEMLGREKGEPRRFVIPAGKGQDGQGQVEVQTQAQEQKATEVKVAKEKKAEGEKPANGDAAASQEQEQGATS